VVEHDIINFVLCIDDRLAQTVLDDRGFANPVPAGQGQPTTTTSESSAVVGDPGVHALDGQTGGSVRVSSTGSGALHDTERTWARMPKDIVEETSRLRVFFAR